jgi:hypothetical protein
MFLSGTGSEFGAGGTRWGPVVEVFARVEEPLATAKPPRRYILELGDLEHASGESLEVQGGHGRAPARRASCVVRRDGHGFSGYGPAESDDCRAATAKRWVAGREEVGSSADRHPTAQKKECRDEERENRRAGSLAGTAALDVATAPVKKLQASLRRDYNREHDGYKILWSP